MTCFGKSVLDESDVRFLGFRDAEFALRQQLPAERGENGIELAQCFRREGNDGVHVDLAIVPALVMRAHALAFAHNPERCIIENDFRVGVSDVDHGNAARCVGWRAVCIFLHACNLCRRLFWTQRRQRC
jgi:hypothetical protein